MSLDSTSTLAQIRAAYADNVSYAENDSLAECAAFIAACRLLVAKLPERVVHGGRNSEEIGLNIEVLERRLQAAEKWHASKRGASRYVHPSFADFRR